MPEMIYHVPADDHARTVDKLARVVAQRDELRRVMALIAEHGELDGSPFALSAAKTARAALAACEE